MEIKKKYKKYIEIGKVVTTHGLDGFLKVDGWCDDLVVFDELNEIYLDPSGRKNFTIEEVKFVKNFVLIKFKGVEDLEEARKYKGKIIYVKRENLKLENGAILIQDLIGVEVYDYFEQNINYGRIKEVIKTAANDVYVISDVNGKERLIPVIDDVIKKREIEKNKIYINVIEGLFDV